MPIKARAALIDPYKRNGFIKKVVSSSLIGYLAARIVTVINPLSALVFNLTAEVCNQVTSRVFKKIFFLRNSIIAKGFIKNIIAFSAGIATANLICEFTLIQAIKITALTVITQIAIANILFVTAILGGFAIFTLQAIFYVAGKLKS